jgi:hypothetical protein
MWVTTVRMNDFIDWKTAAFPVAPLLPREQYEDTFHRVLQTPLHANRFLDSELW